MRLTAWDQLPLTVTAKYVAQLYSLHPRTLYLKLKQGSSDVPQPAFLRPIRWRRDDVRKHFENHSIVKQRAELARAALGEAS